MSIKEKIKPDTMIIEGSAFEGTYLKVKKIDNGEIHLDTTTFLTLADSAFNLYTKTPVTINSDSVNEQEPTFVVDDDGDEIDKSHKVNIAYLSQRKENKQLQTKQNSNTYINLVLIIGFLYYFLEPYINM